MQKKYMYDVNHSKIYKDLYRPSTNIFRFLKTVLSILLVGDSPISSQYRHHAKKLK